MQPPRAKAQTVRGPVDPADLGPTLIHEHVLMDFTPLDRRGEPDADITLSTVWDIAYRWTEAPGVRRLDDPDVAVRELGWMLEEGGRTVVDVSTRGMTLFPPQLRSVAERTGAHVVIGCGRYLDEFMTDADRERSVDDLAAEFVRCIREGYDDTGVKAGIIGEVGCSWPRTEAERRSLRAAVEAQQQTGAALTIHPGRHVDAPFEIVDSLRRAGADLSRSVVDHVDRRLFDEARILRLADTGVVIEFDLFGVETSYYAQAGDVACSGDAARLDWIRMLITRGHGDRVLISHDISNRTRLRSYGGHGYGHIFRNVVPMMKRRGYSDDEVRMLLVDNPARLLAFAG